MKKSAGLLVYRQKMDELQFFLVHPGGPFWKNKDAGAWSIPKGEFTDEDPLAAAIREFREETGVVCAGKFIPLQSLKLKSGKQVFAWAHEKDIDISAVISNTFMLEWPPRSGKMLEVPEIDKGGWFSEVEAKLKINTSQAAFIDQLIMILNQ